MARFIQADFPTEHAGVVRFTRGFAAVRRIEGSAGHAVLAVLASIGSPLRGVGSKLSGVFAAWSLTRKQRTEDDKLWAVALGDARVMADLSRAMSADATRQGRGYY